MAEQGHTQFSAAQMPWKIRIWVPGSWSWQADRRRSVGWWGGKIHSETSSSMIEVGLNVTASRKENVLGTSESVRVACHVRWPMALPVRCTIVGMCVFENNLTTFVKTKSTILLRRCGPRLLFPGFCWKFTSLFIRFIGIQTRIDPLHSYCWFFSVKLVRLGGFAPALTSSRDFSSGKGNDHDFYFVSILYCVRAALRLRSN